MGKVRGRAWGSTSLHPFLNLPPSALPIIIIQCCFAHRFHLIAGPSIRCGGPYKMAVSWPSPSCDVVAVSTLGFVSVLEPHVIYRIRHENLTKRRNVRTRNPQTPKSIAPNDDAGYANRGYAAAGRPAWRFSKMSRVGFFTCRPWLPRPMKLAHTLFSSLPVSVFTVPRRAFAPLSPMNGAVRRPPRGAKGRFHRGRRIQKRARGWLTRSRHTSRRTLDGRKQKASRCRAPWLAGRRILPRNPVYFLISIGVETRSITQSGPAPAGVAAIRF